MNPNIFCKAITWGLIILQALIPGMTFATQTGEFHNKNEVFEKSDTFSGVAQILTSDNENNVKNSVTTAASGTASATVQEWLNSFGTAQVNLNVDDNGKWDGSSFDFLYPLYDNKKSVLFMQMGARAPDSRMTGNFGVGVRTYHVTDWMFGGNFFVDNDFTGKNRRIGIGAEAWTDYLKLSANTYMGTTEWHSSRDFEDYNEKPADGYDVRAEGYLPAWPQLGAKVMYEKYYGHDVALFDKEHLQQNPSTITTGLSYTPVPLVTAGVDYRMGQSSLDEFKFSLNFRYELGNSLQSQLSSGLVSSRRMLAGSRYDLVERNNEITLQYKKKESTLVVTDMILTSMKDNSPADGITANTITLHALNSDGHAVRNAAISWSVSGHGKLINSTGITDASGNVSVNVTNTLAEKVVVTATSGTVLRNISSTFMPSVAALDLLITKNNAKADSVDQNSGTTTVRDVEGNVMSGVRLSWKVDNGANLASSDSVTNAKGQASASFFSPNPGKVKLTVDAGGKSKTANSTFVSATVPVSSIAVSMTTNNALADGTSANAAQALVTRADGQPMAGISVTWSLGAGSAAATTPLTTTTNASGVATLSLTDTAAESVSLTASAGGKTGNTTAVFVASKAAVITMSSGGGRGNVADPGIALATVTDINNKPVSGARIKWSLQPGSGNDVVCTTPVDVVTDAMGVASIKCHTTSINVFNFQVTATVNSGDTQDSSPLVGVLTRDYLI